MAIRSKEELLAAIQARIGDDDSDEAIALLEDVSDTLTGDGEDWKAKYEENDKAWRTKYKERFMGKKAEEPEEPDEPDDNKTLKFEELFETKEEK